MTDKKKHGFLYYASGADAVVSTARSTANSSVLYNMYKQRKASQERHMRSPQKPRDDLMFYQFFPLYQSSQDRFEIARIFYEQPQSIVENLQRGT